MGGLQKGREQYTQNQNKNASLVRMSKSETQRGSGTGEGGRSTTKKEREKKELMDGLKTTSRGGPKGFKGVPPRNSGNEVGRRRHRRGERGSYKNHLD